MLDNNQPQQKELTLSEVIELGAIDYQFYCKTFFPNTVRQNFAEFHDDAWAKLESEARLVNLLMYRGSAKTTNCRLYTSKSIAYGFSNLVLYTGKSEGHAVRSTSWLKRNVENNTRWAQTFNLRKGRQWPDSEFEIMCGDKSVWVIAAGIEGSIRGLNRDDFRPDLIVLDDVLDDENAHTAERRQKIARLVYGALLESLAPKSEAPHAKMIALNTPQHKEDFAVQALKDPGWVSAVYGCFTKETANLPLPYQMSSWEERTSTEELRKEKQAAASRNMLSTFLREKECKLVSAETANFKVEWLKKYEYEPENFVCVYSIDPVPPPSDIAVAKGLHKTDFECHAVWGAYGNKRFLLDYRLQRGHEPTWTIATFFELQNKWRPLNTLVESVAYQRTLMWILKNAMQEKRQWFTIKEYNDRRKKFNRIVTTINPIASRGDMYIKESHVEFLEQFAQYPDVSNDDILDASAIALEELEGMYITQEGEMLHRSEIGRDRASKPKMLRVQRAP